MAERMDYHEFRSVYHATELSNNLQPTRADYTTAWNHYKKTGVVVSAAKQPLKKTSPKKSPVHVAKKSPKSVKKTSIKKTKKSVERVKEKLHKPLSPLHAVGYNIGAIVTPQKTKKSPGKRFGSDPLSSNLGGSSRTPSKTPIIVKAPRASPIKAEQILESTIDEHHEMLGELEGYAIGEYRWYHRKYLLINHGVHPAIKSPSKPPGPHAIVVVRVELFPYQLHQAFGAPKITGGIARWKLRRNHHEYTLETTREETDAMTHEEDRFWFDGAHVHDFDVIGRSEGSQELAELLVADFGTSKEPIIRKQTKSSSK